jgi:formylglycine-generating enzyme required for sulfatase activity
MNEPTNDLPGKPDELEAIKRQIAELQAKLQRAQVASQIEEERKATHGTLINGCVKLKDGNFIGRDFIQMIQPTFMQPGDESDEVKHVAHYLRNLVNDLSGLKLTDVVTDVISGNNQPLRLADVYVPMRVTQKNLLEQVSSALEVLAEHPELILLGPPGSGKTTFGASVLLACAQVWQGFQDELLHLGKDWKHGALLPIRVVLRRFSEQLSAGDRPARAGDVWNFIGQELQVSGFGLSGKTLDYLKRIASTHGALVLLDGLDECGNLKQRNRVLAGVKEFMKTTGSRCRFLLTARPYAWEEAQKTTAQGQPDATYTLAEFNRAQIKQFINAWYNARLKLNPGCMSLDDVERKIKDMEQACKRDDLLLLAKNPLLLTLMAALHTQRSSLPDDRVELYNESVDLLMLRWNHRSGPVKALLEELAVPELKISSFRGVLEKLALQVHEESVGTEGPTDINEHRLIEAFRPLVGHSRDKAATIVEYIENRAGLLIGQGHKKGERQFTFAHRTFQEYLAACALAHRQDFNESCVRLARQAPAHWAMVLPMAARVANVERGAGAADALVGRQDVMKFCVFEPMPVLDDGRHSPVDSKLVSFIKDRWVNGPAKPSKPPQQARCQLGVVDWECALLAGAQLKELGRSAINSNLSAQPIAERVKDWLQALMQTPPSKDLSAVRRAQAGDLLSSLGDPRFNAHRLQMPKGEAMGFVRIAADAKFRIGRRLDPKPGTNPHRAVQDSDLNEALTPTAEFYMACYPVTVAQFRAFVQARAIKLSHDCVLLDPDTRPVRYVNWREAAAYCHWLHEQLQNNPVFDGTEAARLVRQEHWQLSLPSELEWEKAAKAGNVDGAEPPSHEPGLPINNRSGSGVERTSVVGCFLPNPYGLYGMLGNVREWTCSLWGPKADKPAVSYPAQLQNLKHDDRAPQGDDEVDHMVVRSDSWQMRIEQAYTQRSREKLTRTHSDLGFRVVLRAPQAGIKA